MTDVTAIDNSDDKNSPDTALEAQLDATLEDLQAEVAGDSNITVSPGTATVVKPQAKPEVLPTDSIKVKSRKDAGADIPVRVEQTKRVKLNQLLELMAEFEHKELKAVLKVDKRRRRAEKLQAKNQSTLSALLGN